jgi:hypothetical protein
MVATPSPSSNLNLYQTESPVRCHRALGSEDDGFYMANAASSNGQYYHGRLKAGSDVSLPSSFYCYDSPVQTQTPAVPRYPAASSAKKVKPRHPTGPRPSSSFYADPVRGYYNAIRKETH